MTSGEVSFSLRRIMLLLGLILVSGIGLKGFLSSAFYRQLDTELSQSLLFDLRERLGNSPFISEKIKVFGLDDMSVSRTGSNVISSDMWADLFSAIDRKKPRAIVVDAVFQLPLGNTQPLEEISNKLNTPIYSGSFVYPSSIAGRTSFDADQLQFNNFSIPQKHVHPSNLREDINVYGYHKGFSGILSPPGHFVYQNDNKIRPYFYLKNRNITLPHITFNVAERVEGISSYKLNVDGSTVQLDQNGKLLVNFSNTREYYNKTYSLYELTSRVAKGKDLKFINEGDIIIILPLLYTGNTDFKKGPFSHIPGGFILVSMINSIVTGEWIEDWSLYDLYITLVVGVFYSLVAALFSPIVFLMVSLGGLSLSILGVTYGFSMHGIYFPIVGLGITHIFPSGIIALIKYWNTFQQSKNLRHAFEGFLSEKDLRAIMDKPMQSLWEADQKLLSIVFIDIVAFSVFSMNMPAKQAFEVLKKFISEIIAIVHKHGGVVDRTLGDGILCYFGYNFIEKNKKNHADNALAAALEMQAIFSEKVLQQQGSGVQNYFPLRIGINTAPCFLGNLGSANRIDFTIVSNGVNFAKRLETACESHHVLISPSTYRFLTSPDDYGVPFIQKKISVKHVYEEMSCYDVDAVPHLKIKLAAYETEFKQKISEYLKNRMWHVIDDRGLDLLFSGKACKLIMFSPETYLIQSFYEISTKENILEVDLERNGQTIKIKVEVLTRIQNDAKAFQYTLNTIDGLEENHRFYDYICNHTLSDRQDQQNTIESFDESKDAS